MQKQKKMIDSMRPHCYNGPCQSKGAVKELRLLYFILGRLLV